MARMVAAKLGASAVVARRFEVVPVFRTGG